MDRACSRYFSSDRFHNLFLLFSTRDLWNWNGAVLVPLASRRALMMLIAIRIIWVMSVLPLLFFSLVLWHSTDIVRT